MYRIGDLVQLKGGGPVMTITNVGDRPNGQHVWTAWHTGAPGHQVEQTGFYHVDAVRPAQSAEATPKASRELKVNTRRPDDGSPWSA
jgi:uncharacterized protein YodC (DUF2158 family)